MLAIAILLLAIMPLLVAHLRARTAGQMVAIAAASADGAACQRPKAGSGYDRTIIGAALIGLDIAAPAMAAITAMAAMTIPSAMTIVLVAVMVIAPV
ncbi:hypothetical protein GCM10007420_16910 [Glycocaulis albus]|uniref:Uncharacterized protein n=1 Tax=Glycocaulis albus TaxID=1382801 RepID=A0ABQ1XRP2_9PROT|nr:hypothetical protein GCM10007420_16910 [Glycocaulis albus]